MALNKKDYLYVDGYNVINAWSELKSLQKHSLEDARNKLIDEMAEYASLMKLNVVLVFDAYNSDAVKERFDKKLGITIVYTKKFQTADTFIEKEMNRLARRHNVRVVTDDSQIQSLAFERGASRMTSLELKYDLINKRQKIKRRDKKDFQRNFTDYPLPDHVLGKLDKIKEKLDD